MEPIWKTFAGLAKKLNKKFTFQPGGYGSALYDNRFIYFFAGDPHPYAIQRLELNESEKLEKVEVMGNQRGQFFSPVLVKTDYFCG